ncbi:hypothetical protein RZS08_67175, partial [Arthrospira platensis SPKY1]|nr:hypothetical protein [Arthrospira platensis SPKY1]
GSNIKGANLYLTILINAQNIDADAVFSAKNWEKALIDPELEEALGLKGKKRFQENDMNIISNLIVEKERRKEYLNYISERLGTE